MTSAGAQQGTQHDDVYDAHEGAAHAQARLKTRSRVGTALSTSVLAALLVSATWMGTLDAGYFAASWTVAALAYAVVAIALVAPSLVAWAWTGKRGVLYEPRARGWVGTATLVALAAYAAWTLASIIWSPDKSAAQFGAGQALMYLLAFYIAQRTLMSGARVAYAASAFVAAHGALAIYVLYATGTRPVAMFENARLVGTAGYANGEGALLLMAFWVAIYLASNRNVNFVPRIISLGCAAAFVDVAILTQSRGAAVALLLSAVVYALASPHLLRTILALTPVAGAAIIAFPALNAVYAAGIAGGDPAVAATADAAQAFVYVGIAGCAVYAGLWCAADALWTPGRRIRVAAGAFVVLVVAGTGYAGTSYLLAKSDDPVADTAAYVAARVQEFSVNPRTPQADSRFLSASGTGRPVLWRSAYDAALAHPVLGVGTNNWEEFYYEERRTSVGHVRQPHSLVLEAFAERGVVGGSLLVAFIGLCAFRGARSRLARAVPGARPLKAFNAAALATAAYFVVHANIEWFWQLPAVTVPAMVAFAALSLRPEYRVPRTKHATPLPARDAEYHERASYSVDEPEHEPAPDPIPEPDVPDDGDAPAPGSSIYSPTSPVNRAVVGIVALAASLATLVVVLPVYNSDAYVRRAQDMGIERDAIRYAKYAQAAHPSDPRPWLLEAEIATELGIWNTVPTAYAEVIARDPRHYKNHMHLADFYRGRGMVDEAIAEYRKALELNPLQNELRTRLSNMEAAR